MNAFQLLPAWKWDECINCGDSAVTHRGLYLLGDSTLGRIGWCSVDSCTEDRALTEHMPVRSHQARVIDGSES